MRTTPTLWPQLATFAATSLALALTSPSAHAQSGYTLTTLKPATTSAPLLRDQEFFIDPGNRVVGRTSYDAGYRPPICIPYLTLFCSPGGKVYTVNIVAWPASTATAVAPVKVTKNGMNDTQGQAVKGASPDGRIVSIEAASEVYDTTTGSLMAMAGQLRGPDDIDSVASFATMGRRSIDNRGVVAINGLSRSYLWDLSSRLGATVDATITTPLQLPAPLPKGQEDSTRVNAMAHVNLLAGEVRPGPGSPDDGLDSGRAIHPALWVNGQLQVIDRQQGRAIGVNQVGQVLLQRPNRVYSVWFNGTETPIRPLVAGEVVVPIAINASGVVVGRSGLPSSGYPDVDGYRNGKAFIWRNGVTSNLNQWVASKGLKLPSGTVLEDVRDLNDQGSLVVVLRNAYGTRSIARLTAKP